MTQLPFPSNDQSLAETQSSALRIDQPPWKLTKPGEMPPMMFQVRFQDGRVFSYAYADLRETQLLHSGELHLFLYGMEKSQITIVGRRLDELANGISAGRIRWLAECDAREVGRDGSCPCIKDIFARLIEQLEV